MKKFNHIFTLLVVALVGLSLTACSEDLNTDQYTGSEVSLGAYGPAQVLRGGTLFFYGVHLEKVTEVILPGQADPVTDITVIEEGQHSKISIVVPAEGGTEGTVILKTADGREIKTATPLTFREDISISKIYIGTEGNLSGEVGDVLTIEGDYLNLMWGVTFTGGYTVSDLVEHTRYKLSVVIPKEAASGKITLTDLAELPTELQGSEVIEIKLPEATAVSTDTPKAGETITITGTDLDQIESIELPGVTIATADITVSDDGTTLSFVLPEAAADGDITLVTYSAQKIVAATITTVTPTNLAVSGTVKNGLPMTVTGIDMQLVKSVTFEKEVSFTGTLTTAADKIVIDKVPDAAVDGNLTLTMQNGKTVTVAYTLVKPTVTSADPATLTAGNEVTLLGTDLDLVAAVTFPGDVPQTVEAKDFADQQVEGIILTVPAACYGSGMTLTLKNETEIKIAGILTINAASDPAISEAPTGAKAGEVITIKGKNFNNIANLYIGTVKVTRYSSKSNTEITFTVPTMDAGDYKFVMEDYDGKKYDGPAFSVIPEEVTIWEGSCIFGNWDNGNQDLAWGGYDWTKIAAGTTINFYYTKAEGWSCISLRHGQGWGALPAPIAGQYDLEWNAGDYTLSVVFPANVLEDMIANGGLVITGANYTLTKVTYKE